jgi:hypothetical protein
VWIGALTAVLVLYSPWIAVLMNQAARVHDAFWIAAPTWSAGAVIFQTYAGSRPLALVLGVLAAAGAFSLARRPHTDADTWPPLLVLGPWLAAPIVLPLVVSLLATPIFLPKYAIAASIPFAILAAHGVMRLPHVSLRLAILLLIGVLGVESLSTFYDSRRREGWKSAVALVEALAEPGDVLLYYPEFNHYPFDQYRTRTDLLSVPFPLAPLVPIPPPGALDDLLRDTVGDKDRVWLIALQGAPERVPIAEGLARTRTELQHIVVEWLEVDLFVRPK